MQTLFIFSTIEENTNMHVLFQRCTCLSFTHSVLSYQTEEVQRAETVCDLLRNPPLLSPTVLSSLAVSPAAKLGYVNLDPLFQFISSVELEQE